MTEQITIDEIIMNILLKDMKYQENEKVVIIGQEWTKELGETAKELIRKSEELSHKIFNIYLFDQIDISMVSYKLHSINPDAEVPAEIYKKIRYKDIIFAPTAFSITKTHFIESQVNLGARIASMPALELDDFKNIKRTKISDYKSKEGCCLLYHN